MKCNSPSTSLASIAAYTIFACSAIHSSPSLAQEPAAAYPARSITLVVPYGAGSTTDIYARVLAEGLSQELHQAVVVENRAGAGGSIGLGQALRAAPDGYALMLVTTSSIAINGTLYSNLTYDPAKDITVLNVSSTTPNALIVPSKDGIETFADFKKMANGSALFFNSQGSGTSQHLSAVLLSRLMGIKAEHVAYRGQEAITGMIGGQTAFAFASIPSVLGLISGGKIKALAITGSKPSSALPGVPTLSSLGYAPFASGDAWYGVGVSKEVPVRVKETIALALSNVAANERVQAKLADLGFEPMTPMSSLERGTFVDAQVKFWSSLVRESGAKVD